MSNNRFSKGEQVIDYTYIVGLTLILSSIIYFFAANWSGLSRDAKILLVILFILVFYGCSFLFRWMLGTRPLIGKLFLFSGVISFGVGVALIGQTYNSHADSYLLFLIWLIPAVMLAYITRFQAFYVLSYVLFHLMAYFYMVPSSVSMYRSEGEIILLLVCLAIINIILFVLLRLNLVESKFITYATVIIFHLIWIILTFRWSFESYNLLLNGSYILLLTVILYLEVKGRGSRSSFITTVISLATFISIWLISWTFEYFTEFILFFIVLFVIALIIANIYFIRWLRLKLKMSPTENKPWWQKLLVGTVSAVSALLVTLSFVGLTILFFGEMISSFYVIIGLLFIVVSVFLGKQMDDTVKYTLIHVGILLALAFSWDIPLILAVLFLCLLPVIWTKTSSRAVRVFVYLSGTVFLFITMLKFDLELDLLVLIFVISNSLIYMLGDKVTEKETRSLVRNNSLFYGLLFGFILTFFELNQWLYVTYNSSFFIITTFLGYRYIRKELQVQFRMVSFFWFAFLFYKYYDLVWKLVHKSIALSLLGIVFLLIAILLDRKKFFNQQKQKSNWVKKDVAIMIVIVLQISFVGYQYFNNEHVLSNGALIKLELEPVDPRSLLQGDYVVLNYEISTIESLSDQLKAGQKIQLVLSLNEENDFHEYAGIYYVNGEPNKPYQRLENDVVINGVADGSNGIIYGIENYFIEEGTGLEIEQEASYAYVRVATNGNSLIVDIE